MQKGGFMEYPKEMYEDMLAQIQDRKAKRAAEIGHAANPIKRAPSPQILETHQAELWSATRILATESADRAGAFLASLDLSELKVVGL